MEPSARISRTPVSLSDAIHKRLNAYACAASAAGVGVLALAQPAEAKIVYTPAHLKFTRNTEVLLDLNRDGLPDFRIANNFSNFGNRNSYRLFVSAYSQPNSIQGMEDPFALRAGARIGPKQHFSHLATSMAHFYTSSGRITTSSGPWKNVKNRYLGFKFRINGKTHYGWARLSVTMHRNGVYGISALLTGYAYETVPNRLIIAGKTKGTDVVTFEPATLGHLARGATAISSWRVKTVSTTIH
jgi:hypothetical protein